MEALAVSKPEETTKANRRLKPGGWKVLVTPVPGQRVNASLLPASTLMMLPVDFADLSDAKK